MMPLSKNNSSNAYNLNNCFGFGEEDVDLSVWNRSSFINSAIAQPLEFQVNKPYRLALYVRSNERRRLNVTNSFVGSNCKNQKAASKKNDTDILPKVLNKSQGKSSKKNKKTNSIMLFDENSRFDNGIKKVENSPDKSKLENSNILKSLNTSRKKVLTEVNAKPVTKTRQYKIRRSYERKCKYSKEEIIVEKPSNEIVKELELKKLSRTKVKKPSKEELEFEKWASDVNSDFNDVDKFELSMAYD